MSAATAPAATPAAAVAPAAPVKTEAVVKKAPAKKVRAMKVTIDCTSPVNDKIFDLAAFESFLKNKIKVAGKVGNLGTAVNIRREKNHIVIVSTSGFPKHYLKYLTKKFLKKNKLRDWLRVIAASKGVYELRYYNIQEEEEEEEEEEEPEAAPKKK